jgi:hypothetical protein
LPQPPSAKGSWSRSEGHVSSPPRTPGGTQAAPRGLREYRLSSAGATRIPRLVRRGGVGDGPGYRTPFAWPGSDGSVILPAKGQRLAVRRYPEEKVGGRYGSACRG